MKNILLAAALSAVASLNAFGAPCFNGTLASLSGGGSCTVGAADQWSLSSFGLFSGGGGGFNANATTSDIFVSFINVTSVGGGPGFAVRFSDAAGGNNFFVASAGFLQDWRTQFVIETGPAIQRINNSFQGASVTNPQPGSSNGSLRLNKAVSSASDVFINDITLLAVPGLLIPASGSADVNIPLPNTLTGLIIRDNFQIQGGVDGVSSLNSYTNTFYAADPASIPEPATFVLMGAGLAGLAALRRRNG